MTDEHHAPPSPKSPLEMDDDMPRRRFTIGSVRELNSPNRNLVDTGVPLKSALKAVHRVGVMSAAGHHHQRKQTTFSPTLTLITESEDCKPIIRTASLGNSYGEDGQLNLSEVAKMVRHRLSVIREQQDASSAVESTAAAAISSSSTTATPCNGVPQNGNTNTNNNSSSSVADNFNQPAIPVKFFVGANNNRMLEPNKLPHSREFDEVWKEFCQNPYENGDDSLDGVSVTESPKTPLDSTSPVNNRPNGRRIPPSLDANAAAFRPGQPV